MYYHIFFASYELLVDYLAGKGLIRLHVDCSPYYGIGSTAKDLSCAILEGISILVNLFS